LIAFFRILAILVALGIIGFAGAFVVTRERRYLQWAWLLLKVGVAGGFVFFGVLIFQRIWHGGPG
jgi:uncharacterized membrane protein